MNPSRSGPGTELVALLTQKIVGQPGAFRHIVPYIQMYQAGLAPPGRPIGNFLLLGPTGTGKTRTVEALAEILHGRSDHYVRIDCGEYQLEHETAKLIGAPPGYLGHRETTPALSQSKIQDATSKDCNISLVLFDEIEKAAPSMTRMLLGVLDRAILKLGDNSEVNFEHCLIFLTSNLGASDMFKEMRPMFGFEAGTERGFDEGMEEKLEAIALASVRKRFSPEFVNRIDAVVTYQPLRPESLSKILDNQIRELQQHVNTRLGAHCFEVNVDEAARQFLLDRGTSTEYGARELKRVVHRQLMQPLASLVVDNQVPPGGSVKVEVAPDGESLEMHVARKGDTPAEQRGGKAKILIIDDNPALLTLLRSAMSGPDWDIIVAESAASALTLTNSFRPSVALVDYILPDLDGLELSGRLRQRFPGLPIIIMTGGQLSADEQELCRRSRWLLLQKPFVIEDLTALIKGRLAGAASQTAR